MVDGLSGHSRCFANELVKNNLNVLVITSATNKSSKLAKLTIMANIEKWNFSALSSIKTYLTEHHIDTIFIQYTPFAFSKRGGINYFIPYLIFYCRYILNLRVHTLFHEINWPFELKIKSLIMYSSHQIQAFLISIFSNQVFVSNTHFIKLIKNIAPWIKKPIVLNSGSNLPFKKNSNFKSQYDLNAKFLFCMFGGFHPSKRQELAIESIVSLPKETLKLMKIVFIGQTAEQIKDSISAELYEKAKNLFLALGHMTDQDAANTLAACDAFICPYIDGVNSRRGTLMAAMQLGVPIISCRGKNYEEIFEDIPYLSILDQDDEKFKAQFRKLIPSLLNKRDSIETKSMMKIYQTQFSWNLIIEKYLSSWRK